VDATQVIDLPRLPGKRIAPDTRTHAKRFLLAFTVIVLLGTILLSLPWTTESGTATSPVDAFFTAVSASAVTGLVVVDTQDHWNFAGELVILVLIQAGGLGFMVGASLVLATLRQSQSLRGALLLQDGAPTLSLQEATTLSRHILRYILVVEAIGVLVLLPQRLREEAFGPALWRSVFTSISAFCNAGFDLEGNFVSLAGYSDSPYTSLAVMVLIQAGALSYLVVSDVWSKRRWDPLLLDVKLVITANAFLLASGAVIFLALEWQQSMTQLATADRFVAAAFQSTTMRTAGFATVSFGEVHPATLFLTIAVMLVGGASGSTAGGIKLATFAVIAIAVLSTVRGSSEPQAFRRRIPIDLVFRAMAVVTLFVTAHFLLTLALAVTEDVMANKEFGFLPIMFETMSAMATVGLSTGITPELSTAGKLVVCLAMFIGRMGPLTAVYALQRRQRPIRYRYPETSIRIG
jgi:trk system potassium uptake protein TrkH